MGLLPSTRVGGCALALGTAGLLAVAGVTALAGTAGAASTLGAEAVEKGRYFGAAVAANHLGEAPYVSTLNTEFNSVTPENEMKWDATERTRGSFTFGSADQIVNHAQRRGMKVRGVPIDCVGFQSHFNSASPVLIRRRHPRRLLRGQLQQGRGMAWSVSGAAAFRQDAVRAGHTRCSGRGA